MDKTHQFVFDGPVQHREAMEQEIRAEVIAEYAEQLAVASIWKRLQLRWAIGREVMRRVKNSMFSDSLY